MEEPILIKAGSNLLRLGVMKKPPKVDCRVIAEEVYQKLKKDAYKFNKLGKLIDAHYAEDSESDICDIGETAAAFYGYFS